MKPLSFFTPYWVWGLFTLPALMMFNDILTSDNPRIFGKLVHTTGEFSARFLIVAMMATPLAMLFKGWRGPIWLKKNRRHLGVAAFGYAALHAVFYFYKVGTLDRVISDLPKFYIWTGWIAFIIFIPLAITSMDYFVRKMGPNWKTLQRWTYPAAVLTLLHWAALHDWRSPAAALIHFAPLAALEAYRVWYWYIRKRPTTTPAT
ncbi:MAG: sulfoxide reductase heme-binding subunit YedZ [Celeribacter sp.]|jgi:sulfoxide reductase heme-binding subunit YedZ